MKTPFLPNSDLETFASRYLGLTDGDIDTFYEQYYSINVDDELDEILDSHEYAEYF